MTQAVTELDVTTGTPVTEAKLIEQGYYYRDAFRIFRAHADDLFSVTVWGLTDGRSWRVGAGAPLLFDANLQGQAGLLRRRRRRARRPAADGVRLRRAASPLDAGATDALEWQQLPLHRFGDDTVGFQLRWEPDHLTAYVEVADATPEAADAATFVVDDTTYAVRPRRHGRRRRASSTTRAGGWKAVVHLPLSGAAIDDQLAFDVAVDRRRDDGRLERRRRDRHAHPRRAAVVHRGRRDGDRAGHRRRDRRRLGRRQHRLDRQGRSRARAARPPIVRTLWQDNTLYVLAEVTDPILDVTGSDPWIQDSVEIYVDAGNVKNGSYRFDDTQIRINCNNVVSFGTGDEAFQAQPADERHAGRRRRLRRRGVDQPARGRRRGHVPRARLPGERRDRRRPHVDPQLGRPDRPRLPEHLALGRRAARRPRRHGAGARPSTARSTSRPPMPTATTA